MLSIIAEKGQGSDQVFNPVSEISHWSLRDRIEDEQHINWNEEDVLVIASVLKVRKVSVSPTLNIPLEMHVCFLFLR